MEQYRDGETSKQFVAHNSAETFAWLNEHACGMAGGWYPVAETADTITIAFDQQSTRDRAAMELPPAPEAF